MSDDFVSDSSSVGGSGKGPRSGSRSVPAARRTSREVCAKATRRTFSAAYKLAILAEVDACSAPGEVGAILRREGLYASHLGAWRRARKQGQLDGLSPRKRGPKPNPDVQAAKEIDRLKRQTAALAEKLRKANIIIDAQKKFLQLLDDLEPQEEPQQ